MVLSNQAKGQANKKLNPKANTYDDIGYTIRIHRSITYQKNLTKNS